MLLTREDHALLLALHARAAGSKAIVPLAKLLARTTQYHIEKIAKKLANMAFTVANVPNAMTGKLVYLTGNGAALGDAGLNYLQLSRLVPQPPPAVDDKQAAKGTVRGF